ncbi:MAG: sodium:solute symporter family protein [Blastocatellia bacterium]
MSYLLFLVGYALLMALAGVYVSRHVRVADDFFVAGRGLGPGLIFSTLLAANIGAGSTVGAAGFGYRDGLSAWWWVGSAGIGCLILAFTVGPRIWRVARDHQLLTVGDYLEHRFDGRVRALAAALLWLGALTILAGQLIAVAWILNTIAGWPRAVGCMIAAVVATAYFTLGGLPGAARVNALQLVIKLIGFGLALAYLLRTPLLVSKLPAGHDDFTGIGPAAIWRLLATLVPAFIVSPGLLQKIFGARDARAVRLGVSLNGLVLLLFAFVPALLGMIAHFHLPPLANHELAMPALMTQLLPLWLGGLLLGAIFSAEVSTADAVLFMLCTSLSRDLYQRFLRPQADAVSLLRVTRICAVVCGLLGGLLATVLPGVLAALEVFYTLLTAALLIPIVAGLYTRRVTADMALLAMIASVLTTAMVWWLSPKHLGYAGIPPVLFGVGAGLAAMSLAYWRQRAARL